MTQYRFIKSLEEYIVREMARTKRRPVRRKRRATTRTSRRRITTKRKSPAKISKATISRPKKKMKSAGPSSVHHAVRRNPFSSATQHPKIPDGALGSSLSRRLVQTTAFANANGTQGPTVMHLIMAPTLGVPIVITNTVDGLLKRPASSTDPQFVGFNGQTVGFTPMVGGVPKWPLAAGDTVELTNNGGFSKWRIVSQGLRLELNETDDTNNGWFEACRFNWNNNNHNISFTPLDGTTTSTTLGCAPNPNTDLYNMSIIEQRGYMHGQLKDLGKIEFNLHPQSPNHEPKDLSLINKIVEGVDINRDTSAVKIDLGNSSAAANLKSEVVDTHMDWIYIRFYPRNATLGGSNLVLSLTQNLEFAFNPDSDLSSFQTENKLDPKHAKVVDDINNDPSAFHNRRK